jgi:hypothetical protein
MEQIHKYIRYAVRYKIKPTFAQTWFKSYIQGHMEKARYTGTELIMCNAWLVPYQPVPYRRS